MQLGNRVLRAVSWRPMEHSTTTIEKTDRGVVATAAAFVMLTKPRIIELLLITTVPSMIVAKGGMPDPWLVLVTVIGGTLAAGGANTFNMFIDRDIDQLMKRTQGRPLVTGAVSPRSGSRSTLGGGSVSGGSWRCVVVCGSHRVG